MFIAFEGIDGSGKSTQIKLFEEYLNHSNIKTYSTFEPTDSLIGTQIRDILRHKIQMHQKVIAPLFVADRLNHLLNERDGILKKLSEGYTVLIDRYFFSSLAYQGSFVDMDWVIQANSLCTDLLKPDWTFYIDITPEESIKRLKTNRPHLELYESLENLSMIQSNYELAFQKFPNEKISRIIGNQSITEISYAIINEWENTIKHSISLNISE